MTSDSRRCWKIIKELLQSEDRPAKRDASDNQKLCNALCNFFLSKISVIAIKIGCILTSGMLHVSVPLEHVSSGLAIHVILIIMMKTSLIDYISTSIHKGASDVFSPLISKLTNLSFSQGKFPMMFKVGQGMLLPKKCGIIAVYRPITNLNMI